MTRRRAAALVAAAAALGGAAALAVHARGPAQPLAAPRTVAPVTSAVSTTVSSPVGVAPIPVRAVPAVARVAKARPRTLVAHTPRPRPTHRGVAAAPVVRRARPAVHLETPAQRGRRVLASLHYDWQRLGYTIVFRPERKGYLGFTDGATKTVTIWVRTRETDTVLAHTIAHELGHVLDFTKGSAAKHATYLTLRGMNPATNWYGCNGCTDYATPAGDWAEVFAYWLAGPGDFRSQLGAPPDAAHMKAIALLYSF